MTAPSRRSTAMLTLLLPLALVGISACDSTDSGEKKAPDARSAPSPGTSSKESDSQDGEEGQTDGGVVTTCSSKALAFTAKPVAEPAGHVLITAQNTRKTACRMPTEVPIVTFAERHNDADVIGPETGTGPTLAPGRRAYAGLVLTGPDGANSNGLVVTTLHIRLGSSSRVAYAPIEGGVVTIKSPRTTVWSATEKGAFTY